MSKTIKQAAVEIVDEAGMSGGRDEVRRIAERGWPEGVEFRGYDGLDREELRTAVQDLARRHFVD